MAYHLEFRVVGRIKKPVIPANRDDTAEMLRQLAKLVHEDPCWIAKNMYGLDPWRGPSPDEPGQAEVIEAIFQERVNNLCVSSGHAVGKTFLSGVLPNMWMDGNPWCHVVVTGAAWSSVQDKLIPNIRSFAKFQRHLRPIKSWKGVRWNIDDNWSLIGISPSIGEVGQGWHSVGNPKLGILSGTFAMADEASKLTYPVHKGLDSLISGELDCYFLFGNPIEMTGPFADICRTPGKWKYMRIDARYNPNYRLKQNIIPGLMTYERVLEYLKETGGEDSQEFSVRVAGKLPGQSDKTLISMRSLEKAKQRMPVALVDDGALIISVDVARSEVGDKSCIMLSGQTTLHYMEVGQGWTHTHLVQRVQRLYNKFQERIECIKIDAIAIGSPAADALENLGLPVVRVIFSSRAHDIVRYYNCRAEAWDNMREAIDSYFVIPEFVPTEGGKLYPAYDALTQAATIEVKSRDPLQLEKKDVYKARTNLGSPDIPDTLAIRFARQVGNPAFDMLQMYHYRLDTPDIVRDGRRWRWHLESSPREWDCFGFPVRLSWLSAAGYSASVLLFLDTDGCWFIFDCVMAKETTIQSFWRRVLSASSGLEFDIDLVSGPEDVLSNFEYHTINTIQEIDRASNPIWVQATDIRGRKGLDYIEALLLSSLSRAPLHDYWKKNPILNSEDYHRPEQIYFWNRDAFDSVFAARKKARISRDDMDEEVEEGLISDGGPVVRCLRLLAIKGGAYTI